MHILNTAFTLKAAYKLTKMCFKIKTHLVCLHACLQSCKAAPSQGAVGFSCGRSCEGISPLDCPAPDRPRTRALTPDHCRMMPA